jgi:hypothetical protein
VSILQDLQSHTISLLENNTDFTLFNPLEQVDVGMDLNSESQINENEPHDNKNVEYDTQKLSEDNQAIITQIMENMKNDVLTEMNKSLQNLSHEIEEVRSMVFNSTSENQFLHTHNNIESIQDNSSPNNESVKDQQSNLLTNLKKQNISEMDLPHNNSNISRTKDNNNVMETDIFSLYTKSLEEEANNLILQLELSVKSKIHDIN